MDLAAELGIKPSTLYRYVGPTRELRENGERVFSGKGPSRTRDSRLRSLTAPSRERTVACGPTNEGRAVPERPTVAERG